MLAPLKPYFSYRHYLVFCWLLVAHLSCFEKATLQALARHIPGHVAAWHLRRLLPADRAELPHIANLFDIPKDVLITETLLDVKFATYTNDPFGVASTPTGSVPTATVATML